MNTIKKTFLGLFAIAALYSCSDNTIKTDTNSNGSKLNISLTTGETVRLKRYELKDSKDSMITIENTKLKKSVIYVNFVNDSSGLVDRIYTMDVRRFAPDRITGTYNRGDAGTKELFCNADENFRYRADFLKDKSIKIAVDKIQQAMDIPYK